MAELPDDLPRRVLDGSPDAILISAQRVFGFSGADALGVSMDLIIRPGEGAADATQAREPKT